MGRGRSIKDTLDSTAVKGFRIQPILNILIMFKTYL